MDVVDREGHPTRAAARAGPTGRDSIPPEQLLKASFVEDRRHLREHLVGQCLHPPDRVRLFDVHGVATVHCVLDAEGTLVERGSIATTAAELGAPARRLSTGEEKGDAAA